MANRKLKKRDDNRACSGGCEFLRRFEKFEVAIFNEVSQIKTGVAALTATTVEQHKQTSGQLDDHETRLRDGERRGLKVAGAALGISGVFGLVGSWIFSLLKAGAKLPPIPPPN